MVKKIIIFYIAIIAILIIGGFFAYYILKEKLIEESPSYGEVGGEESKAETGEPKESTLGEETTLTSAGAETDEGEGGVGGGGGGGGSAGGTGSTGDSGETTPISDQTICQNSQNDELCDGLDVTYGEGYRTICCSEHSLCC